MMKKVMSVVMIARLVIAFMPVSFANEETYTPIYTVEDLMAINDNLSGNYILMNDIDLSEYDNWSPLASLDNPFTGVLDGNGKLIYNNSSGNGLFINVVNGQISNLKVHNKYSNISSRSYFAYGGIANSSINTNFNACKSVGEIDIECSGFGLVTDANIGGLVGKAENCIFKNCENEASIVGCITSGSICAGGLVGSSTESEFNASKNYGKVRSCNFVDGTAYSGGIAGVSAFSEIYMCINDDNIIANVQTQNLSRLKAVAGGICGSVSDTKVSFSYNKAEVSTPETNGGNGSICGGIIGNGVNSSVMQCYNTGVISVFGSSVSIEIVGGGIIGLADNMIINDVYNIGNIYTKDSAGWSSFCGLYSGGLIGKAISNTSIINSYVALNVFEISAHNKCCGDIIGFADNSVIITNIYCLQFNDKPIGVGEPILSNVKTVTTEQLKTKQTFDGFDFANVWRIDAGEYPRLRFGVIDISQDISINGRGYAYLRYKLVDKQGNTLRNTAVNYYIDGYEEEGVALTDENGIVCVNTPELFESQDITITFTSPYGIEIADNVRTEYVTVEPLSYSQSWKGQLGAEGEIGFVAGVEGYAGVFSAEASAASASFAGGLSSGLSLENSYDNGNRKIKISSTIGADVEGKVSAGLWADGAILDVAKVKVSPIEVSAGAKLSTDNSRSLIIENYDPTNPEHLIKIATFLICGRENNIIARKVYDKMIDSKKSYIEEGTTQTITIKNGIDVGKVKLLAKEDVEVGEFTIGSIGPTTIITMGSAKNLNDGSFTFFNGLATSLGYDLLDFSTLEISKDNKDNENDKDKKEITGSMSVPRGIGIWGDLVSNNIEFESEFNSPEFEKFIIRTIEEEDSSGVFVEKISSIEKNVIYSGDNANELVESDEALTNLALGQTWIMNNSDLADVIIKIAEADVDGNFEKNKKYSQIFDISLGGGFGAVMKFKLGINLKGVYSDSFTYQNGSISDNIEKLEAVSTADDEFETSKITLTQLLAEPFQQIENTINENSSSVEDKVSNGISNAGATVKGNGDYLADITYMPDEEAQSFSVLAVAEEEDVFDTSSVAMTVGEPYIVTIKDQMGNTVEDFSNNPLKLTLEYSPESLSIAKINNTAEDLRNLKIYRYDEDKDVFVYVGGEVNYENLSVTADITKSGQYILAVDNCAPSVTEFKVTNGTATPTFNAVVADMSGIKDFSFKIDGKEYVNDSNLYEFYSPSSAYFEYKVTEALENGEHEATITASDTAGNVMINSASIKFTVDNTIPVIDSFTVSDKVVDGKITVSAFIEEEDLNTVKLHVQKGDRIATYELNEKYEDMNTTIYKMGAEKSPYLSIKSYWEGEAEVGTDEDVKVWIAACDNSGNSSESEKIKVENTGISLKLYGDYSDKMSVTYKKKDDLIIVKAVGDVPEMNLYVAEYEGDKLINAQIAERRTVDGGIEFIVIKPKTKNYKIMLWDEDMYPVIDAITEQYIST